MALIVPLMLPQMAEVVPRAAAVSLRPHQPSSPISKKYEPPPCSQLVIRSRRTIALVCSVVRQPPFEQPGAAIDGYVVSLAAALDAKMEAISGLRRKLSQFQGRLQEEETLSASRQA